MMVYGIQVERNICIQPEQAEYFKNRLWKLGCDSLNLLLQSSSENLSVASEPLKESIGFVQIASLSLIVCVSTFNNRS